MTSLIELTTTEQTLQDSDIKVTLKEIADKYGKQHNKLVRAFTTMLDSLTPDRLAITEFGEREFKTKEGNIYPTYELPIKTLIWFIAKFDHNLRHDVVMYAFKKLEEDQKKLIDQTTELISQTKQLEKVKQKLLSENKDLKASRFNEYEGYRSVTKLSHKLDLTIGVSEMLDHLEAIGEIETFTETVQRRRRTEDALYGDEDSKLNPRYTLSEGRQMFKDYLKIK